MRWLRKQRRSAPRVNAGWDARYRRADAPDWASCRVLDLSLGGAAIELDDGAVAPQGDVVIDLRPAADGTEGFVLRSEVRNTGRTSSGRQRVGVMFVEPNDIERHVLADLVSLQTL